MLTFALIVAAAYLVSLVFMARAVKDAPEGFEDGAGFHSGRALPVDLAEHRKRVLSVR